MCSDFWVSFSELLYFVGFFFSINRYPFWVDFTNICIFFLLYIMCISSKCFGHKIFVWFLYSWAYVLITATIFLGSIFDTG